MTVALALAAWILSGPAGLQWLQVLPALLFAGGLLFRRKRHSGRRILILYAYPLCAFFSAMQSMIPYYLLQQVIDNPGNPLAIASAFLCSLSFFFVWLTSVWFIVYLHSESLREQCNKHYCQVPS